MDGTGRAPGGRVREPSTKKRTAWSRADAPTRGTDRTTLRSRLRDRGHATNSPAPPREHRQAPARAHRRTQSGPAHANTLRIRETQVPPGPTGGPLGDPPGVPTIVVDPLPSRTAD